MPSSALQQQNSGFVDPFDNYDPYAYYDPNAYYGDSGLPGAWLRLFGQDMEKVRAGNQTLQNQAYERASIQSARAWSEYMDSTQIQRRVKDLEAAGLNPWLAVQNGISGSGAPSVDTGGSAQHQRSSGQSKSNLAVLLMAIARILG